MCVNLYPFEQTVARGEASEEEVIENIDIGGPTMIRAAAKNRAFAAVVVDPADYEGVLGELRESEGRLSLQTPQRARGEGVRVHGSLRRGDLDVVCHAHVRGLSPDVERGVREGDATLRYGENPHQRAAFYARVGAPTHLLDGVEQLHGKELSFNNLLDLSSARELVEEFTHSGTGDQPACAIVKHNNPCGCAVGETIQQAYERAFACDPQSAYGGVIAVNRRVDRGCAEELEQAVHRGAARPRV